jgi:hypothetical protein
MSYNFNTLKRSRGSVEKLTQEIQKLSQNNKQDDRFWEPTVDKAGNGHAIIRFLPAPPQDGEDGLPWVRMFSHSFQGPGGWFINNCPTTIEEKCPVCEGNNVLWNSGIEANQAVVRTRKRKLHYIANILVVSDPAKPENDGKVKLFKFGKKIFDKVYEKMHPEFPDEVAFSPFDLWDGANFKLKIRRVDDYRNYDKSEFAAKGPVADSDEKMEAIWKQEQSLKEFLDKKNFKPYDQLENRRAKVIGTVPQTASAEASQSKISDYDDDEPISTPKQVSQPAQVEADDEDLSFFKNLADK